MDAKNTFITTGFKDCDHETKFNFTLPFLYASEYVLQTRFRVLTCVKPFIKTALLMQYMKINIATVIYTYINV